MVRTNIERGDVRQGAFQSVAHLNRGPAIVDKNKKDNAVALVFLTDAPALGDALRISGNVIGALHFRKDRNYDLV